MPIPPPGLRAIPVILDTDIGTDIDDTWALAQALRCPELDVKLVLVSSVKDDFRARIVAKFLEAAGRTDIPIGLGVDVPLDDVYLNQNPWIKGYKLSAYAGEIVVNGIDRMIRIIEESHGTVTVIGIEPSVNLAEMVRRSPQTAAQAKLVGMFGSFFVGYDNAPEICSETNVRVAPEAFRKTMSAPWKDVLLTPLDTCGSAILEGENYRRIWGSMHDSTLRAVIENYCIFAPRVNWMDCDFFAVRSTVLFDCVAVYLAYSEEWVETETVRFRITEDGYTLADSAGEFSARIALRWKSLPTFLDHLTERLLGK